MSIEQLTLVLAERVMHWGVAPERFLLGGRRWLPRWRFQPATKLVDAIRLLDEAVPEAYSIRTGCNGNVEVCVRIAGSIGEAHGTSKARVITCAVARALGIEADL